jgi:hypothetical protein
MDDQGAVPSQVDVQLDTVGAPMQGLPKRPQGILEGVSRGTSVSQYARLSPRQTPPRWLTVLRSNWRC